MDQKAGRDYRITRKDDIQRAFAEGRSARDALLTLLAIENALPHARCGVGVSRRHGRAVRRNRIKRLCREAFRLSRSQLPLGWDYMLIPRVGGRFDLEGLRRSVVALAVRATRPAEQTGRRP